MRPTDRRPAAPSSSPDSPLPRSLSHCSRPARAVAPATTTSRWRWSTGSRQAAPRQEPHQRHGRRGERRRPVRRVLDRGRPRAVRHQRRSTTSTSATPRRRCTVLVSHRRRRRSATTTASSRPSPPTAAIVAFTTWATNLVKDTKRRHPRRAGQGPAARTSAPGVGDLQGAAVREEQLLAGDLRQRAASSRSRPSAATEPRTGTSKEDVYVRDLRNGTTKQASLLPGDDRDVRGPVLNGDISDDGRKVVVRQNTKPVGPRHGGRRDHFCSTRAAAGSLPALPTGSAGRPDDLRQRSVRRVLLVRGSTCPGRPATSSTSTAST